MAEMKMRYKMSAWMIALFANCLILAVCVVQCNATLTIARAEAKSSQTESLEELSAQAMHEAKAESEKVLSAYLKQNVVKPAEWVYRVEAFLFRMDRLGWSNSTVKDLLHWANWLVLSIVVTVWTVMRMSKIVFKLKKAKFDGKIEMRVVKGYDLAITGRSVFYVVVLLAPWLIGIIVQAPILGVLAGLLVAEYCEALRFRSYGGVLFGEKKQGRIERPGKGWLIKKIATLCDFDEADLVQSGNSSTKKSKKGALPTTYYE